MANWEPNPEIRGWRTLYPNFLFIEIYIMRVIRYHLIILFVLVPLLVSSQSLDNSHDYPFHPVPFTQVHFNDLFWAPRLEQHRLRTLPYTMEQCQSIGRVKNFAIAAGEE